MGQIVPAVAMDSGEVQKLRDDVMKFYQDKEDDKESYSERTSLRQRFQQMDRQPETLDGIYPVPKTLVVKRSFRCKKCDHNLLKPEYNPSVVKFKLQLSAM